MNIEEQVISWAVASGNYSELLRTGTTPDHFLDPINRSAFIWISRYQVSYGETPTPDALLREFPDYPLTNELTGPIEYLVDQLRAARQRTILELGLSAADTALERDDIEGAAAVLAASASAFSASADVAGDIDAVATFEARMERYRAASSSGGLLGVPTGFSFLDAATQGLQAAQMIVLAGLAKSCKTTILLAIARAVHAAEKTPLIVSFEMSEPEVTRRLDGFWAGVNPNKLLSGSLSAGEWRRLEGVTKHLAYRRPFVITEDRANMMTISGIRAKVELLQPDVLFIDGAYFLMDEVSRESQTPLALTNISRGLKRLAMSCGIPVVITTQALPHKLGRGGAMNMYSAGYTSAWAQDADVLMGTQAVETMPGLYKTPILASRNSLPGDYAVSISWEPPDIKEIDCEDADGDAAF